VSAVAVSPSAASQRSPTVGLAGLMTTNGADVARAVVGRSCKCELRRFHSRAEMMRRRNGRGRGGGATAISVGGQSWVPGRAGALWLVVAAVLCLLCARRMQQRQGLPVAKVEEAEGEWLLESSSSSGDSASEGDDEAEVARGVSGVGHSDDDAV
jgi:hypothetical protein